MLGEFYLFDVDALYEMKVSVDVCQTLGEYNYVTSPMDAVMDIATAFPFCLLFQTMVLRLLNKSS